MKRRKSLIILLCALVALTACYVVLNRTSRNAASQENKTTVITNFDSSKIVKITLASQSQTLNLAKNNGTWTATGSPKTALDNDYINDILSTMSKLSANRVLDNNPSDTSNYGLNPPSVTATAVLSDGSQKVFYLGDPTPDASGYYLMMKGDTKLYTIPDIDGTHLSYTLDDIQVKDDTTTP